ncbi:DUF3040 domain-containing protein [Streptomyces cellostaticus]|uniref:DUF3040 domain-containing protein n=1 Tax=Streptomyces TaxID=1883 RepID=UPI0020262C9A|nr:DUF3040 domain-containing protein [Streptomyces cellostaticus]
MDDWETPEDVRLSPRERLALLRIEANLRQDRRLARRMHAAARRMAGEHRSTRSRRGLWLPLSVALLLTASAFAAVSGVRTSAPAPLWCFALLWPLTLVQSCRLLCRVARRARPGRGLTRWH